MRLHTKLHTPFPMTPLLSARPSKKAVYFPQAKASYLPCHGSVLVGRCESALTFSHKSDTRGIEPFILFIMARLPRGSNHHDLEYSPCTSAY
jgi:hypothetical protein